jgi:hypothetical protein
MHAFHFICQFLATHARHHDIGEEQIKILGVAVGKLKGIPAVSCFHDVVTGDLQKFLGQFVTIRRCKSSIPFLSRVVFAGPNARHFIGPAAFTGGYIKFPASHLGDMSGLA